MFKCNVTSHTFEVVVPEQLSITITTDCFAHDYHMTGLFLYACIVFWVSNVKVKVAYSASDINLIYS